MITAPFRLALLSGVALAAIGTAAAQDRVGVATAVNPAATAEAAGQAAKTLVVGGDVIYNETITTGPAGQVQILFVDRSSLTVGPDTKMVIDEFVYDRDSGKGTLTASVTQGVLRYVGGAISKNEGAVNLKTPVATIGIRGGITAVDVGDGGATTAGFIFGKQLTVTGNGGSVTITRPGFATTVGGSNPPGSPIPIPTGLLNALAKLDAKAGAATGSGPKPTDATVTASGIGRANSGNTKDSTADASKESGGPETPAPVDVGNLNHALRVNTVITPPPPTAFLTATGNAFAFNLARDTTLDSQFPFVRALSVSSTGADIPGAAVSQFLFQSAAAGTRPNGDAIKITDGDSVTLQTSLGIEGTGAAQHSVIAVSTGQAQANGPSSAAFAGVVRGSSRVAAADPARVIESGLGTAALSGSTQIDSFTLASGTALEHVVGTPDLQYAYSSQATAAGTRAAASRTSQTLTGYAAGIGEPDGGTPYIVTGTTSITTDQARNRLTATLALADPHTPPPSGVASMTLQFGSLAAGARSDSAFIDDRTFAATESSDPTRPPATRNGAVLVVNGDPLAAARSYLVVADLVPQAGLLPATASIPAGQLCSCEFLRWGWWGSEVNGVDPSNPAATRLDRFHLGTWIAGQPTAALVQSLGIGSVTFNGRAVGSVDNNGTSYLATGAFVGNFDLGARTGNVEIQNFDTRTYSGTVAFNPGANTYSTTLAAVGFTGSAKGNFFGPAANETGGSFSVNNTSGQRYQAAGVFAAKR
jgi:hypothetical protein